MQGGLWDPGGTRQCHPADEWGSVQGSTVACVQPHASGLSSTDPANSYLRTETGQVCAGGASSH